jgi:hypothetical protein
VEGVADELLPVEIRGVRGSITPEWRLFSTPERLVNALIASRGQRSPAEANQDILKLDGNRFVPVGAGNNLAQQINKLEGMFGDTLPHEYRALLKISVPSLPA